MTKRRAINRRDRATLRRAISHRSRGRPAAGPPRGRRERAHARAHARIRTAPAHRLTAAARPAAPGAELVIPRTHMHRRTHIRTHAHERARKHARVLCVGVCVCVCVLCVYVCVCARGRVCVCVLCVCVCSVRVRDRRVQASSTGLTRRAKFPCHSFCPLPSFSLHYGD